MRSEHAAAARWQHLGMSLGSDGRALRLRCNYECRRGRQRGVGMLFAAPRVLAAEQFVGAEGCCNVASHISIYARCQYAFIVSGCCE